MSAINVLLVDDEQDFLAALAERLRARDLAVEVADSGAAALARVNQAAPAGALDVVVLDLWMPGLNGLAVLAELRRLVPACQVIMLTGRGSEQNELDALRLGAYAFLRKPVELDTLLGCIQDAAAWREKGVSIAIAGEPNMAEQKVLLVDDEVEFTSNLSQRLELRGIFVATAASGPEALAKAKTTVFDAVILDLAMPGMDGLETLKRLRSEQPEIYVILLTGHGSIQQGVEAIKLGAMDFLEKPVDIMLLLEKVRAAREQKKIALEKKTQQLIEDIVRTKGW